MQKNTSIGDLWSNFVTEVVETIARWETVVEGMRRDGADLSEEDEQEDNTVFSLIRHLQWLVPMVERLQEKPLVRSLYPMVHHGVLELHRYSPEVSPGDSVMIYAMSEKMFRLSHRSDGGKFETICEDNAEYVADAIEAFIRRE